MEVLESLDSVVQLHSRNHDLLFQSRDYNFFSPSPCRVGGDFSNFKKAHISHSKALGSWPREHCNNFRVKSKYVGREVGLVPKHSAGFISQDSSPIWIDSPSPPACHWVKSRGRKETQEAVRDSRYRYLSPRQLDASSAQGDFTLPEN